MNASSKDLTRLLSTPHSWRLGQFSRLLLSQPRWDLDPTTYELLFHALSQLTTAKNLRAVRSILQHLLPSLLPHQQQAWAQKVLTAHYAEDYWLWETTMNEVLHGPVDAPSAAALLLQSRAWKHFYTPVILKGLGRYAHDPLVQEAFWTSLQNHYQLEITESLPAWFITQSATADHFNALMNGMAVIYLGTMLSRLCALLKPVVGTERLQELCLGAFPHISPWRQGEYWAAVRHCYPEVATLYSHLQR